MILRLVNVRKCIQKSRFCTTVSNKKKSYSDTIFLPKTKFPIKLESTKLIERDEKLRIIAEFDQLYKWQRGHLSEPEFVLHDGPPYANGNLHMGHAINKILKDTILRYHIIKGNKVHYIPGWDCHGLPIELKALLESDSDPLTIRSKARNFAKTTIEKQMDGFKSWGIIGDWSNAYATYNPQYVKVQMKIFNKLFKKNLIYRDFKPIYWSPSTRTALAEAELEYNENHKSSSAFVRIKLSNFPNNTSDNLYALIWTTTPWTLPSNQAIAYNPQIQYSIVRNTKDDSTLIIAKDLISALSKTLNITLELVEDIKPDILLQLKYIHPIFKDKILPFLPATHPTVLKGTGLVHTAPAHGPDDFLLALNNKIQIEDLVDELGCFNENAGKQLEGKSVLEAGTIEEVFKMLRDDLIHTHDYVHSYPYDWRTKRPVIIRASMQWFIDTNFIKTKAMELLEHVTIFPKVAGETYKRNLLNQIENRSYWCISRQRKWGVPIPVFLNKFNNNILINDDIVRYFCELVDKHGTDFWWKLPNEQLIPPHMNSELNLNNWLKGEDILDIWFDSGISWATALEGDKVADMYLEGVDQFTGWFQSSLITSVALREKAPYKSIYVHGFAVDEKGMKMSKSIGNVIDPDDIIKGGKGRKVYGIDTLRWWVACHANQDSTAHISDNVLQSSADELQKIRNAIRFAIGSLSDFRGDSVQYEELSLLDKYVLNLLYNFQKQTASALQDYQFHKICANVINLLTNAISAVYYTAIKDRLYCDPLNSPFRKASQYVLLQIYETITQSIAPVVPHLVEEMHLYYPLKNGKTYFTSQHSKPLDEWENRNVEHIMRQVLEIKKEINKQLGVKTLSSIIELEFSNQIWNLIKQESIAYNDLQNELEDIFQVSGVVVMKSDLKENYNWKIRKSEKFICNRCRRVQANSENELCNRCANVVKEFVSKTTAATN